MVLLLSAPSSLPLCSPCRCHAPISSAPRTRVCVGSSSFPIFSCEVSQVQTGASTVFCACVCVLVTCIPEIAYSISNCTTLLLFTTVVYLCSARSHSQVRPSALPAATCAVSFLFLPTVQHAPAHIMSAEQIEGVIERITYTKGVLGVVVCTSEGTPIRDSFQNLDRSLAQSYAAMAADLARQAAMLFTPVKSHRAASESSPQMGAKKQITTTPPPPIQESSVELIRVRTLLHEIIIRCSDDFLIAVVQEPVV
ncbi:conserved hypothetical protein [Leishmania infantum JPCM5]|uniref:Roadblock/LAMTOR2 domain-containing protein n=1 Tax=Leishmania infantum TaxID=5671 RepID=A4I8H6_LEIIN|nr:conserved hypothetical protein [Leishmania infantum JPCM5]CAM71120.1 conserved hypothetical protein [Leishmania infantum JPCM5]|eukprot:XP_001468045.1 conserved hypothetical protein [Leishmania infantum JPCM5]